MRVRDRFEAELERLDAEGHKWFLLARRELEGWVCGNCGYRNKAYRSFCRRCKKL